MSRSLKHALTEQEAREDTAAFINSWRARGGFAGALNRVAANDSRGTVTSQHMPFPGHRHCGETGG